MYIAHKREDGKDQPLSEHLAGVAKLAGRFAEVFDAKAHAHRTGELHDAGKYSPGGQRRMEDPERTAKVDHASAGAQIAWGRCHDPCGALAVAGHHGGIPDCGGSMSAEGDGTLQSRLRKPLTGDLDYSAFWSENAPDMKPLIPDWLLRGKSLYSLQFYTRMLFSCLVDADFLDTEAFMRDADPPRGGHDAVNLLNDRLREHVRGWLEAPEGAINQKRCEILRACMERGPSQRGLYSLTVPTGGGKTVASLAFALAHAMANGMDRVIYVIPYTSIIEQNARVFSDILGPDNVVEHHSGMDCDAEVDQEKADVMRRILAAENWDAPVIVTTAVQFFESLHGNKPSRCRKLHNIANSVIIFDEAQMLPLQYLKPCVAAIAELVSHYNSTAVLCTATQPSLDRLFADCAPNLHIREIVENPGDLYQCFRRVHFERRPRLELEQLAAELSEKTEVLCIVNTRKTAQAVYEQLPCEGSYHLSTRMTPEHRSRVLREIRQRLQRGEVCRVVSTSLIEAGVDVDFPEVWRELAGLDSILQAAGRCNREGRRSAGDSAVVVFSTHESCPRGLMPNVSAAEMVLEGDAQPDDAACVHQYFEKLYFMLGDSAMDAHAILEKCQSKRMQHKRIAGEFHLIESDTWTVYIPNEENAGDLEVLRYGKVSRGLMRRLGRSGVSVSRWDWDALFNGGSVEKLGDDYGILSDTSAYDPNCGLKVDCKPGMGLWV